MKIVKIFVLALMFAMAGYVYASGAHQAKASIDKTNFSSNTAGACKVESCCEGKQSCSRQGPDCCKATADCCKEGTECCGPQSVCCGPDHRCCDEDDLCCVDETKKDQCCASEAGQANAKPKGWAVSSCRTADVK